MKERFKVFPVLVFVLILTSILAACSSGGASSNGNTVKIGANFELSGDVASYGSSMLEGVQLAVKEINAQGGLNGKEIELVEFDNASKTDEAVSGAQRLTTQENVLAIFGAATSGNTAAQIDIANSTETILIAPGATAPLITVKEDGSVHPFVFRTSYIDPFQGEVAAQFAIEDLEVKTAALYIDNGSDYSIGVGKAFTEKFESLGGTVVAEEAYVGSNDTDFRSTLTRLNSKDPEFIFIPGYYGDVGLIVAQARELGIDVPLMGADGWDSPTLVELAGPEALNNTYFTAHYSSDDESPKVQEFVKNFSEAYDKSPNTFNALGYDTVYLFKDAVERAGSFERTEIRDALEETKDLELVTGVVTINETHDPIKSAVILELVDGKQVFNTRVEP